MEQIQTIETEMTYQEFERKFDKAVGGIAEGFVETGFYLKYARDKDILAESPYRTMAEFARAKYGMDKSMTSRFIAINDRFSEGGYSDRLKEQYRGYGYTKLSLMLTLPDEINQELSPAYSKAEIQAIKDEVDEEKAISDLEVMMEPRPAPAPAKGLLNMLIRQLGEDSPELYIQMVKIMNLEDMQEWTRKTKETMAPDAEKTYSIRISGTGRFMVSIRETEDTITVTALRTLEKSSYTYQELHEAWEWIMPPGWALPDKDWSEQDLQTAWEATYNREYPGKVKVAPVQQSQKPKKTESKQTPRKESKVQKAPKPAPAKAEPPVEEKQPVSESEKPESTGTELVQEEPEQTASEPERTAPEAASIALEPEREPQESEQPMHEPEKPKSTGREQLFHPGMRVRNTGKIIGHPVAEGTITKQGVQGMWWVKYDGNSDPRLITPGEANHIEIIDGQSEQLPGQIGIENKGEDDPDIHESGQLDAEWDEKTKFILDNIGAWQEEKISLSRMSPDIIRLFQKYLINAAVLTEKELLYRGEKF